MKCDSQVFSNTWICPFLSPSYFSPFYLHLFFLCDVYVHSVLVLELCVFCFCLFLLLSSGSVWFQFLPVCMLFSQLAKSLYLCLCYNVPPKVCGQHAPWTFILLDYSDEKCAVFSVICKLCSSFHGFVCVSSGGSESMVVLRPFSHFLWHFKSFLVELWHGCLQASVENIMKEKMPKKGGRWWFSWRSRNSDIKSVGRLTFRLFFFIYLYITLRTVQDHATAEILNEWPLTFVVLQESEAGGAREESAHSLHPVNRWHKCFSPEEFKTF